jgi:tRNA_anti-like
MVTGREVAMRFVLMTVFLLGCASKEPPAPSADEQRKAEFTRAFNEALEAAKKQQQQQQQQQQPTAAAVEDGRPNYVPVAALALADAYAGNVLGADSKYKESYLEVRGPVYRVDRDRNGRVLLEIGKPLRKVRVELKDSEEAVASELRPGRTVVIHGHCIGAPQSMRTPVIENGMIVTK